MTKTTESASNTIWSWEVFLLGGCSVLVCMASWAFMDKSASLVTMSQLAFGLAFAINHPHFLSSYALIYNDFNKNIRHRARYFWAAVIVPVLLGGFLAYSLAEGRGDLLGHSVNLMFFLVGWHYVKQVFGCVIVTSARRRIYYTKQERFMMLTNLFSLWAISWLQSQVGHQTFNFYGINYSGMGLDPWLTRVAYFVLTFSGLSLVAMHLRKYVVEGTRPSMPGMAAMASLYVWYLPTFSHPGFAYLIPAFHSLQYLTFVWSFKKNQVQDRIREFKDQTWRAAWMKQFVGYAAGVLVLGALAFEFVPKGLDNMGLISTGGLGTAPFLAAFIIFINVHHYFIDNTIWRSNNDEVKKYLFAPPMSAEVPAKSTRRAA